ncbi:MAG TPA: MATE family efflux transporter, partial [Planctomycetota bacterium]|nr:MATE family efflux transporter [Planctomycetota bacterium]
FLMIALWVGVSTGLTSALSRSMGAGEAAKVEQYVGAAWRLTGLVVAFFVAVGAAIWGLAPRLPIAADVARQFAIYGSVLVAGNALTSMWSIVPDSIVKAHHDTRATMWAGIASEVSGVLLNTLFMFGLGLGIFGIALSDVLGKLAGLAYALWKARELEEARRAAPPPERASGDRTALDPAPWRAILGLAIPSSLTFALMAAESGILNAVLGSFPDAKEAIAAYSIYFRITMFALQPILALGVAMLPFAARLFGAGDRAAVRRGLREAAIAGSGYAVLVVGTVLLAAGPWLAEHLAESPVTARYAAFALRLAPLACLAGVPFIICRPVFEGLRRGLPGLAMAAVRYLVLTGPAAWLGIRIARSLGAAPIVGLVPALVAVALASSTVFALWTRATLAAE